MVKDVQMELSQELLKYPNGIKYSKLKATWWDKYAAVKAYFYDKVRGVLGVIQSQGRTRQVTLEKAI
jgi:hypothetical protein